MMKTCILPVTKCQWQEMIRHLSTIGLWTGNGAIGIKRMNPPRTGVDKRWVSQCNYTVIISDTRIAGNIRIGRKLTHGLKLGSGNLGTS